MLIEIRAKPNSKIEAIKKIDETHFEVSVTEPPINGRANAAIIRLLAENFNVSPSRVRIILGYTSRNKTVEIL